MSTTPCITYWFGRLGNNIQQISNAIYFCRYHKINFYLPPHELINHFKIEFGKDAYITSRFFFFNGNNIDFKCNEYHLNDARKSICEEYILPNLKFQPVDILSDSTLVLHIRSGDIFSRTHVNKLYVQNPLSYYHDLINNDKFTEVLIVTDTTEENGLNPVIPHLAKNKKVRIQSESVEKDFATLLSAKHLASSGVGTFVLAAAMCSKNITDFYCSTIYHWEQLNPTMLYNSNIQLHIKHIKNYIKVGDWVCSPEQIELMLNHK